MNTATVVCATEHATKIPITSPCARNAGDDEQRSSARIAAMVANPDGQPPTVAPCALDRRSRDRAAAGGGAAQKNSPPAKAQAPRVSTQNHGPMEQPERSASRRSEMREPRLGRTETHGARRALQELKRHTTEQCTAPRKAHHTTRLHKYSKNETRSLASRRTTSESGYFAFSL